MACIAMPIVGMAMGHSWQTSRMAHRRSAFGNTPICHTMLFDDFAQVK